jgi:hypothetical protein
MAEPAQRRISDDRQDCAGKQGSVRLAIKPLPHSIPTELPPAKLYLDDISEILQILIDSSADCQTTFVAGKSKCDTLDDLKDLRGRTTHFVMDISAAGKHQTLELTPAVTRIHVYEVGDQLAAWSKYVNVAAIFERRKLKLKSAVRSLGWWVFAALWLLTVAVWVFVPHPAKRLSTYELLCVATGIAVAAAVVYYFVSSHSIVYLRYPQRVGAGRWLEDHRQEIIVGVICALMGAIATQIVEKTWK